MFQNTRAGWASGRWLMKMPLHFAFSSSWLAGSLSAASHSHSWPPSLLVIVRQLNALSSSISALSIGSSGETGKRERASAMKLCFSACHSKWTFAPTTFSLNLCSWLLVHLSSGGRKNPQEEGEVGGRAEYAKGALFMAKTAPSVSSFTGAYHFSA